MNLFGKKDKPKELEFYKKMIEEIIIEWDLKPDELYNSELQKWGLVQGSVDFFISLFNYDGTDFFECSAIIVKLPDENLLAFYRKLLELNDFYIGVKLAVKDNQVWLYGQRECEGMDKDEARRIIDNVRITADDIDVRLMQEFGASK